MIIRAYRIFIISSCFLISLSGSASLKSILEPLPETSPRIVAKASPKPEKPIFSTEVRVSRAKKPKVKKVADNFKKHKTEINKKEQERLSKNSYKITYHTIMQALAEEISLNVSFDGELKLSLLKPWKDVSFRAKNYELNFSDYPRESLKKRFFVTLKVLADGEEVHTLNLPVKCELWKEVYFSAQRIKKNTVLSEELLITKYIDTLKIRQKALTEDVDLSKYEVSRAIPSEKPILWRNVELKPLIRKGKLVEIIAEDGLMRITAKGLAMESGLHKDFISVKNLQSRKNVDAQILNENTVKVYF